MNVTQPNQTWCKENIYEHKQKTKNNAMTSRRNSLCGRESRGKADTCSAVWGLHAKSLLPQARFRGPGRLCPSCCGCGWKVRVYIKVQLRKSEIGACLLLLWGVFGTMLTEWRKGIVVVCVYTFAILSAKEVKCAIKCMYTCMCQILPSDLIGVEYILLDT